jgi:hypothetical protein
MRYFFHVIDGSKFVDSLGRELSDDDKARAEARAAARHFASTYPEKAADAEVIVNDARRRLVGVIRCTSLEEKRQVLRNRPPLPASVSATAPCSRLNPAGCPRARGSASARVADTPSTPALGQA